METKELAPHVLKAVFELQNDGTLANLQTLTDRLRVRRGDIRRVITALHREGYVDAVRMRLTLRGLAVAAAFAQSPLRPLRRVSTRASEEAA